jgi:hypothetical protein
MFAQCIDSIKVLFISPTDAHNYKITGMLKTIKIIILAPTCFGSRRNHHQGAISGLAKTTIMILLCSSLMTWSMSWRQTGLLCKRAVHGSTARLQKRLFALECNFSCRWRQTCAMNHRGFFLFMDAFTSFSAT